MTTLSEFPTSDLILRVSGGSRDGELIPVDTPKCYLGMETTNESVSENPHCVIFRGRRGAVIRSYADQVMFNDAAASLHWLQKGDTIQFPNAMKVEVVQLGELKDSAVSSNSQVSQVAQAVTTTPNQTPADSRLVVLESELRSIQMQNENSVTRFDQLDNRINMLTEKMTMLINLSANGAGVEVSQASTPSFAATTTDTTETTVQQNKVLVVEPVESSTEIQTAATPVEETVTPTQVEAPTQKETVENDDTQSDETTAVVEQAAEEVQSEVTAEEVIQSPVSPSPLEELDRIDKAIEESVSGYSSQNDDSDEQILTFNGDSTDTTESVTTSDAAVVADQIVTTTEETTEETTSSTADDSVAVETDSPQEDSADEDSAEEAEAAAKAKAISDEAEKESRLSEMERIFGGTESVDEKTTEQSSDAELAQSEFSESFDTTSTIQPADEQHSQSFEDLTHGQNAEVDSSADNSLSNEPVAEDQIQSVSSTESDDQPKTESTQTESTQAASLESQLSPMALQLLQDVKEDQKQEKQEEAKVEAQLETQDSAGTSEPVESDTPVATPVQPERPVRAEPETLIVPERKENESVADLLARMKEDGKWDGVLGGDDDDSVEPAESVQSTPEPEPTPTTLDSSDDSPVDSPEGEGDDVEDYMSQLLSRMRGEEPAAAATPDKKEEKKTKKKDVKKEIETPKFEAPAVPLKAEDFKPKQKATKLKSLDAMRELANSNARTNVKVSETQNRKAKAYLSAGVGLGAVLMSLFYFLFTSQAIIGVVCLVLAGVCGFSLYKNLSTSKNPKAKKSKAPVEATESTEAE